MASSTAAAIALRFPDLVRVAGETLCGRVDLHVALAQEDHIEQLRVKLRGSITTKITTQNGQTTYTHVQTIPLVHWSQILWKQGTAFPEPGSHVLSCPFQFQLPANLPPSFYCASNSRGAISYSLEVVGDRPGLFRLNRRLRRLISVVPAASQGQLLAKESLNQGWSGPWRDIKAAEKMRQGIWGDYSFARATLSLPDLPSFPIATPIPFTLHIMTETKSVHRSERPEDKHGKPLFPAPPTRSSELTRDLHRQTEVRVRSRTRHVNDTFRLKQGIPSSGDGQSAVVNEPEWVPQEDKDRGIWRRTVQLNSTLVFPFAPTFKTETLDWTYELRFVVPFPGFGNNLKIRIPIHLGAGSACPPPPIGAAGSSNITYADILPAGPPPMLDLPPSYWAGEDHDWGDEKN
ncbi:hypothetical protein DFH07DRAFT_803422 [Mycena maculata]|uniref:Arrestin-like N-terminal domain-containing protein n=1 Tax=Mycena maculata TaxID=230809 RepID=A0AAD7NRC7_9AGAR|nr:hypothetical protein DFH07DRAFT_803422 [Mycena maculata]